MDFFVGVAVGWATPRSSTQMSLADSPLAISKDLESIVVLTEASCAADAEQAMDWIESQHGIRNFVLMGLCSGADDAFRAAQADRRVCRLVSMDGLGYRTPRYYLHRLTKHLIRFDKWLALIHRLLDNDGAPMTPGSLQAAADITDICSST